MRAAKASTMRYLTYHRPRHGLDILYSQITSHRPSTGGIEIQIHDGDTANTKYPTIAPTGRKGPKSRIRICLITIK